MRARESFLHRMVRAVIVSLAAASLGLAHYIILVRLGVSANVAYWWDFGGSCVNSFALGLLTSPVRMKPQYMHDDLIKEEK